MRLIEKMVEANHRAVAGDSSAGLRPADYAESLPLIALTCVDPRLNPLLPEVLGIPEDDFIWLRNAGNIISHAFSSTIPFNRGSVSAISHVCQILLQFHELILAVQ